MARKGKTSPLYVLLVGTSVVLFLRGAWGLMDLFVFPNDKLLSYSASVIFGIVILIITHKLRDELL